MTGLPERRTMIEDIKQARTQGAGLEPACELIGISLRTYRRWTQGGEIEADGRPTAARPQPAHRLSEAERDEVLRVCNEPRFASLPPSQIVPRLADEGVYLASESNFYRVLHAADQQQHRGRADAPSRKEPTSHEATGPNQVWCWDITYLPSRVLGLYFYLYLILDLYSRKIVGGEVQATETGEHAASLLRCTVLGEAVQPWRSPLVLHADNGSPMKFGDPAVDFAVAGCHTLAQSATGVERQRLCGERVPDLQVSPGIPHRRLRHAGGCARVGNALCGLAQHRAPAQRVKLRHTRAAPQRAGRGHHEAAHRSL